jgi:hypothetical protein
LAGHVKYFFQDRKQGQKTGEWRKNESMRGAGSDPRRKNQDQNGPVVIFEDSSEREASGQSTDI